MRLNLGCGGVVAPGWVNLDRAGDVDVIHDLADLPLPFDDGSCDGAVAHHVLDLLAEKDIAALFLDLRRILKPDACLRVSSADFLRAIDAALDGNAEWFPEPKGSLEESLGWFITQGGARQTFVTRSMLARLARESGFLSFNSGCPFDGGPDWLYELDGRESESFSAVMW